MTQQTVDAWIDAVIDRHTSAMSRPAFLKAVRALSVRYVERRGELPSRSATDSAGKRAAFAGFYAPLHFLTLQNILRQLQPGPSPDEIVDLGCGTGVAGAAWALSCGTMPSIHGIDLSAWALDEARWNWRALGLRGRTTRLNLAAMLESLATGAGRRGGERRGANRRRPAVVLGWSLNELDARARERAFASVLKLAARGIPVLAVEPIATRLVPWWPAWCERAASQAGLSAEWRFQAILPPRLAELDEAAGFDRGELTARTVTFNLGAPIAGGHVR